MKYLALVLAFAVAVMAVPHKKPGQHWRPAKGRDLSKYKPRIAMYPMQTAQVPWELEMIRRQRQIKMAELVKPVHHAKKSFADICGMENDHGRIVGGDETAEHQWPWIVALFIDDMWFCGGSLIGDEWVMTAAHCADGAGYFEIMAGAHNVREPSEPGRVEITAYESMVHERWNPSNLANDIALVHLPEPISFNGIIRPSCLPAHSDASNTFAGDVVTAIGWGKPSDASGGISPVLRMVHNLEVITNKACNDIYGIVGAGIMCVDTTGGRGTCNGDSGGPLNYETGNKKWKQLGVVSFGSSAGCEKGFPGGFTRVTHYLDWIQDNTGIIIEN